MNAFARTTIAAAALLLAAPGLANDVLPRLLNNVPIKQNFLGLSYTRSEGNVSVDPSLALDVSAKLDSYVLTYTRSFAAWGQSANVTVALPYSDLQLSGIVDDQRVTARDDKMPDPRFRLAINLAGAPALGLKEFAGYRQKTIVGFNIDVSMPLGDYDPERQINFGSNRWTVAPELGIGHRFKRFTIEGAVAAVFFSDNDEYLVDQTLKQEPIGAIRANLIYHFRRPGTWLGVNTLYLRGGETTVDGRDREDLQINTRVGVTFSLPIARRHNLQLRYSRGVTTRIGADFDNYNLAYSLRF
ncbi:MAG: transporter [Pseudomonadota bacterium]